MSEQRDSEVLFPWEIEGGAGAGAGTGTGSGSGTGSGGEETGAGAGSGMGSGGEETGTGSGSGTGSGGEETGTGSGSGMGSGGEETGTGSGSGMGSGGEETGTGGGSGAGSGTEGEAGVSGPETGAGAGARIDAEAEIPDAEPGAGTGTDAGAVSAGAEAAGGEPDADGGPDADDEADGDEDRFAVLDSDIARQAAERASAALRDRPVAPKEYYAISEVCDLVGLKPHVLRYWETQFQVLNPSKNRSGNRVYQRKEIRLIMLVKHLLYEEKYTVEGAKAKLDQLRRGGELADVTGVVLDRAMIEQLRADLSELTTLLTPPTQV